MGPRFRILALCEAPTHRHAVADRRLSVHLAWPVVPFRISTIRQRRARSIAFRRSPEDFLALQRSEDRFTRVLVSPDLRSAPELESTAENALKPSFSPLSTCLGSPMAIHSAMGARENIRLGRRHARMKIGRADYSQRIGIDADPGLDLETAAEGYEPGRNWPDRERHHVRP